MIRTTSVSGNCAPTKPDSHLLTRAVLRSDLSPAQKCVLLAICASGGSVSYSALMEATDLAYVTVRVALRILARREWVVIQRNHAGHGVDRQNVYHMGPAFDTAVEDQARIKEGGRE